MAMAMAAARGLAKRANGSTALRLTKPRTCPSGSQNHAPVQRVGGLVHGNRRDKIRLEHQDVFIGWHNEIESLI